MKQANMCCRYISRCCCGCTDLKTGVYILAAIDFIWNCIICSLILIMNEINGWRGNLFLNGGFIFLIILVDYLAWLNILLLAGICGNCDILIRFWQVAISLSLNEMKEKYLSSCSCMDSPIVLNV